MKRIAALMLLSLFWTGCTAQLTNLTPRQHYRNAKGLYPMEVMWQSRNTTLVKDSIKGFVVIDQDAYPMERNSVLTNRWEALLPIPADKSYVTYRFRFDYNYLKVMAVQPSSLMSEPYHLQIIER